MPPGLSVLGSTLDYITLCQQSVQCLDDAVEAKDASVLGKVTEAEDSRCAEVVEQFTPIQAKVRPDQNLLTSSFRT